MGKPYADVLRISPAYDANDWTQLDIARPEDWHTASAIVKDRLDGRFLRYAGNCLRSPYSGFVVLAIDSLVVETLQQFREGLEHGQNQSRRLVMDSLATKRFQPDFHEDARRDFYYDIRCGLLHQAEANRMWLVRRGGSSMLGKSIQGQGYVIDVRLFHQAVRASFSDYLRDVKRPANKTLRENMWKKMNHICSVRHDRGVEFAPEDQ